LLFNVLRAYAVLDPDVGYCQGMSDVVGFLLMYVPEEDAFWILVELLNNPKYAMSGMYVTGFPRLKQMQWIFDQLFEKMVPKAYKHLVCEFENGIIDFKAGENITSLYYTTKWFMCWFIDGLPFALLVRLWDMFLWKGSDFIYTVAITSMKLNESRSYFDELTFF
jgi:hypothetical protein